ncbi:MAG: ComEA family DNA-binding protein [Ilumatobacteraceae bacterium]
MDSSLPRPAPPRSPIDRLREWVVWFGPARLLATAFAVIAVVVGGTWLLKGSPSRPEDALPFATRATSTTVAVTSPSTTLATSIVVYVAGAVAAPGVYALAPSARVNDALHAAGGPAAGADLGVVNLAATLSDGERVYVPAAGEAIPPVVEITPAVHDSTPAELVNINVATADQLDVLPGVGPATAAAIVAHRQQHGPFQSVEQLGDVRGIGAAKLDALRGLVTV